MRSQPTSIRSSDVNRFSPQTYSRQRDFLVRFKSAFLSRAFSLRVIYSPSSAMIDRTTSSQPVRQKLFRKNFCQALRQAQPSLRAVLQRLPVRNRPASCTYAAVNYFALSNPSRPCLTSERRFHLNESDFGSASEHSVPKDNTVGGEIWVGWVSCSLFPIYNQSQTTKNICRGGKKYLGSGWRRVGEFVGFIVEVVFTRFPTQQNLVNRKTP